MKLMVLDGNSVINRAYYGVRALTTRDGFFTNAIYGFLNILEKLRADEKPDALCVAFDLKAPTFRHLKYDGYKATRHPMPDELAMQMPVMKDVLRAMRIPIFECEGWEADDILGTLAAACAGNALGYTVFKNVVVSMYYNSYSLPTYKTVWNPDAFLRTTLIPVVLMFVVNFLIITRMMRHTPLQFLRHDLKKTRRKKALRLTGIPPLPNWSFFARFRLRIICQNIANYLILFAGVFFIMVMLAMAIGMPSTLKYYQSRTADMMFTNYQYVLKSCEDENGDAVTTQNPDAEAFCMTSLVRKSDVLDEEVSVYGIADGSRYVQIDNLSGLEGNKVYISAPYADKYRLAVGDTFTLDEKYESKQYTFTVAGIYDRCQSIAVFLPMDHYRDIFDLDADAFSGFLSDTEITDIDEDNVATVITERDITKMADQLDHSMGSYMTYFQYLCVLLSAVLIYLLTKLIIEKNENAISMVKILGYENREIARLYLLSTTIVLVLIDAVSVWLGAAAMELAAKYNVEMPIVQTVNAIVKEGMSASDALRNLMSRDRKSEMPQGYESV